jgi:hypothetical protein
MISKSMHRLRSETVPASAIDEPFARELFAIFAQHYRSVTCAQFLADLRDKDAVVLLRDAQTQTPRGFSTQVVSHLTHRGEPLRVLFSGDTIIDRAHWGEQELVRAWCRFAGQTLAAEPTRLFWFLISKGYRTYLYLPIFFRTFFPRFSTPTPEFEQTLIHTLGAEKFGAHYDPARGVATFPDSRGHLDPALADISTARLADPHVAFFLRQNPGHARGDELLCLAEISAENMRGLAKRMLLTGAHDR